MEENRYTIIIFSENKPGVLHRISDLFLRRRVNIESLTVSEIEEQGISRFTIVVRANHSLVEKTVKQLYRIIEVLKVFDTTDAELIFKEIAFLKVGCKNEVQRKEIEEKALVNKATVSYTNGSFVVLEKTGSEEEISFFKNEFAGYNIREFVRSGRIAVLKDESKFKGKFNPVDSKLT